MWRVPCPLGENAPSAALQPRPAQKRSLEGRSIQSQTQGPLRASARGTRVSSSCYFLNNAAARRTQLAEGGMQFDSSTRMQPARDVSSSVTFRDGQTDPMTAETDCGRATMLNPVKSAILGRCISRAGLAQIVHFNEITRDCAAAATTSAAPVQERSRPINQRDALQLAPHETAPLPCCPSPPRSSVKESLPFWLAAEVLSWELGQRLRSTCVKLHVRCLGATSIVQNRVNGMELRVERFLIVISDQTSETHARAR